MNSSLRQRFESAWYHGNIGWLWLLWPLELLFKILVNLRHWLYQTGILKQYRSSLPVVVVGNLSVGGTGKTPAVIALVEYLQEQGLRPAVISRGYGGSSDRYPLLVTEEIAASECGDEPALIASRCKIPVVVGPNRTDSLKLLERLGRCDVVISDDGLQHYAMDRDIELAVVDASRGIGNGRSLPLGPLREPISRLFTLDGVLLNTSGRGGVSQSIDMIEMKLNVTSCIALKDGFERPLTPPQQFSNRVHAVAGIGNPQRFFDTLRNLGWEPIEHPFPDHHNYIQTDLEFGDELPIMMTEKDAVKCVEFAAQKHTYLKVSAEIEASQLATLLAPVVQSAKASTKASIKKSIKEQQ